MELAIYNGFLSDSNEFVLIDTNEISLKKAIGFIQKYIEEFIEQNPSFLDADEYGLKDYYLINNHELWIEREKNVNTSNIKMVHSGLGYSYLKADF